jgi:hypothetical protein
MRDLSPVFNRRRLALVAIVSLMLSQPAAVAQLAQTEGTVAESSEMVGFVLPPNGRIDAEGSLVAVPVKVLPAEPGTTTVVSTVPVNGQPTQCELIVIDNDKLAEEEVKEEWKWEDIPDEAGKTHIIAGAHFPVVLISEHNSKTAKIGSPVEGRLNIDLKIGGKLVAPKGCRVIGHVFTVRPARRILHAELSPKAWMKANGAIGIQFDEIISHNGEHLPLSAMPAKQPRVVINKHEGRVMGVNHRGEVASPLSTQLKGQAAHLAIRAGCSAAGVFSMGAVPLAYGVVGAINPSFAFLKPVGLNVRHRRLKGFAMGVCQGLPGGFLISDMIIKGPEAVVKPGDIFLCEFKEKFTGEPATAAELIPGASTKVQGEVLSGVHEKKDAAGAASDKNSSKKKGKKKN